jgi:two-component system phosphate regulon sensor histidine kinase PhoR
VIGDSWVPTPELARLPSHSERPEIAAALRAGQGSSTRWSSTVSERSLYVARAIRRADRVHAVVRLAVPLRVVDAAIAEGRRLLAVASVVALALAILASWAVAHAMSRSVRAVTEVARRLASGDLAARSRATGADEIGELGRALDHLGASLEASLGALRQEHERTSGIVRAMHEGVLLLDEEGRISLVNPALREMLLLPAEVVGRAPLEVIRHPDLPGLFERARGVDEPISTELEVQGVKPRRLLVRASALRPTHRGVLVVVVDVTDLRRLEGLRRDFVANVSHELRTPVTAIRSAVETLQAGAAREPASAARFLEIVERNAARLQQLVEDLLDLSRIESRQYRLHPERLEVKPVLQHAVALFRERADKKGVALTVDAPDDLAAVRADRRALEQVLANLIDNAVKYTGTRCTVRVRARSISERELEIAVTDDGPGIEARHLPRLFERFYRVDAGRSREEGGTGLGLSIVKHLVEAMEGRVSVESQPERGTTFALTLPGA